MDKKERREKAAQEWNKIKKLTWKEKIGYIWDYYKPVMVGILLFLFFVYIGFTAYQNSKIKDVLNVYMLNANMISMDGPSMADEFEQYLGGLASNEEIVVDASLILDDEDYSQTAIASSVKFVALTAAGDVDLVLCDQLLFEKYLEQGYFMDLSQVLSTDEMEKWKDHLVYGADNTAAAVRIVSSEVLDRYGAYSGTETYAAVLLSASNTDRISAFLEFLKINK